VQHVGAIDFAERGSNAIVTPAFGRKLAETDCVNCGQCAAVCPTAAIKIKTCHSKVWRELYNPKKRVVAQVAPAVRVALGEAFGLKPGEDSIGKIFTAIRMLGFDAVFDTCVGADLTVMEEAQELAEKLEKGDTEFPLFTSCCPAWIRFAENLHPEVLPYISSCKSPMEMFGAVLKEYYKEADAEEGRETVSIAIMPCVAKKMEAAREEFVRDGKPDVDYVITTKELIHMIRESGIQFDEIDPEAPDMPFSISSGAGVIFGVTGGVAEAALRRLVKEKNTQTLRDIKFSGVRGMDGVKEATLNLNGREVHVGVVSGLGNAENLIERIKKKEVHFDFVEVMACPYGCIAGAGQPFCHKVDKKERMAGMYKADKAAPVKRSEENPVIYNLYHGGILENRAHELLHVHYKQKKTQA
jgi:NADH-quinone oxidoreductase subunit G